MLKRKAFKIIALLILIVIVAIQFIPTTKNLQETTGPADFIISYQPPEAVAAILKSSCYDCHSNNTYYPWYSRLQPAAYFMEQHIIEGKEELNFSEFGEYSNRMKKRKFQSIINELENETMPIRAYQMINKHGKVSAQQNAMLISWFEEISK